MNIVLIAIGKSKEKYIQRGIEEYLKRLRKYTRFEYREWSGKISGDREQIMEAEAEWIRKQLDSKDLLVLLDENGKQFSSRDFAVQLEKWLVHTPGRIVFVIGGAYGFTNALKQDADQLLSLSKMTFSHQMIRIFILEQIYRAFTIMRGESYHND